MPCQAARLADEHILSASESPPARSILQNVFEHSVGGCSNEQTVLGCQTGSCSTLLIGCWTGNQDWLSCHPIEEQQEKCSGAQLLPMHPDRVVLAPNAQAPCLSSAVPVEVEGWAGGR
jgi:hypothetical protein